MSMRVDRLPSLKRTSRLRDVIAKLSADEAAAFYFLVAYGQGRSQFTSTVADMVRKTNCSRDRFTALVGTLAAKNLIAMHGTIHGLGSEMLTWTIITWSDGWQRPVLGERKFRIPGPPVLGGGRPRRKAS